MFNSKKKFFQKKVEAVTYQIWDYEFKVAKTQQIREGIRQDRDKLVDHCSQLETQLKAKPKDAVLLKDFEETVDTIKRFEGQLKMLDEQIQGVPAQDQDPGKEGVNDIISSLVELRHMYEQYIKTL